MQGKVGGDLDQPPQNGLFCGVGCFKNKILSERDGRWLWTVSWRRSSSWSQQEFAVHAPSSQLEVDLVRSRVC